MTTSRVALGPGSNPDQYHGRVTALSGANVEAAVGDASGHRISVIAQLQLDPGSGTASGTVSANAGGSG